MAPRTLLAALGGFAVLLATAGVAAAEDDARVPLPVDDLGMLLKPDVLGGGVGVVVETCEGVYGALNDNAYVGPYVPDEPCIELRKVYPVCETGFEVLKDGLFQ